MKRPDSAAFAHGLYEIPLCDPRIRTGGGAPYARFQLSFGRSNQESIVGEKAHGHVVRRFDGRGQPESQHSQAQQRGHPPLMGSAEHEQETGAAIPEARLPLALGTVTGHVSCLASCTSCFVAHHPLTLGGTGTTVPCPGGTCFLRRFTPPTVHRPPHIPGGSTSCTNALCGA